MWAPTDKRSRDRGYQRRRRLSWSRRRLVGGGTMLVLAGALIGSSVSVLAAGGRAERSFTPAKLTRSARITVRNLPSTPSSDHPALHKPFLVPPPPSTKGAADLHVPVVDVGQASTLSSKNASSGTATATSAPSAPSVVSSFLGWSSAQSQTGFNQDVAPPDPQLAAGPTYLLEMVNDVGSVWSKSGVLTKSFDLNTFFGVPSGQTFSDPRVIYDAPSGRWFATGLSFTSSYGSQIYVAVSATSDPTGSWTTYYGDSSSDILHDQPKVGVSADKLVMAWNDFLLGSFFEGAVIWVIQKSDLLEASSSVGVSQYGPDSSRPSIAPAQNLSYSSTDTTAYAAYNDSPYLGLLAITGTPALGNVAMTETDPTMGTTSSPPNADQPGYPGSISTDDTRFLGAVWQGGTLWTSANDGCGSSLVCARVVAVSTASPTVTFSEDLGSPGADVYYPAVSVDSAGDMFAVYTVSSTSMYPSVGVIAAQAGPSGYTLLSPTTVQSGQGLYSYGSCLTSGPCRWGDYSGVAVDPANASNLWMTGEYSAATSVGNNWGTVSAQLSLTSSATPVAAVSPTSLSFGDQVVTTSSSPQTVTVTNTGSATLGITSIKSSDSTDFILGSGPTNSCGYGSVSTTLTPGVSCTFTVTFQPASAAAFGATVTIIDNASPTTQTVDLSGTGVTPPPIASVSPTSISFGTYRVGSSSAPQTVTVTNTGSANLVILSIVSSDTTDFMVGVTATDSCGTGSGYVTLAQGDSCTFTVTFQPASAGTFNATVTISDNASPTTQTVTLSGTGTRKAKR